MNNQHENSIAGFSEDLIPRHPTIYQKNLIPHRRSTGAACIDNSYTKSFGWPVNNHQLFQHIIPTKQHKQEIHNTKQQEQFKLAKKE